MNAQAEASTVRHRVLIVGGGFAGVAAARALAGCNAEVTIMDRRNHHIFQPLLGNLVVGRRKALTVECIGAASLHNMTHKSSIACPRYAPSSLALVTT
jgi:NADH dehydrogenase FAD-containing subunit